MSVQKLIRQHLTSASLTFLCLVGAAVWLYVIYAGRRAHDPVEIVKKHFVFYPEYSHGVWREAKCANVASEGCRNVTYTVPVKGCGPVTLAWRVFSGEDIDGAWTYNGATPRVDENAYALYGVLSEDSRLIESPALGKPVPQSCQLK
jgi:hypothetical protein